MRYDIILCLVFFILLLDYWLLRSKNRFTEKLSLKQKSLIAPVSLLVLAFVIIIFASHNFSVISGNETTFIEHNESLNEFSGSKPFNITPVDGVTLSAEENCLDKDREFIVKKLDEPQLEELVKYTSLLNQIPLAAIEVNAGLKEGECLPGFVKYEFDLEKLGVPAELREFCSILRISDDKKLFPLSSALNGSILVCESNNNSIIVIAMGVCVGYPIAMTGLEYLRNRIPDDDYAVVPFKGKTNADYNIIFPQKLLREEPSAELKKLLDKEQELWKIYGLDNKKDLKSNLENYSVYSSEPNAIMSLFRNKILMDPEFIDLQKTFRNHDWQMKNIWPKSIKTTVDNLVKSDDFLFKFVGFPSPGSVTDIYVINSKDGEKKCAEEKKIITASPYILVYKNNETYSNPNNLLLTLTHEMTHVLQDSRYFPLPRFERNPFVPYMEATAVMVEKAAFDYYLEKGIITDSTDITTANNEYQYLASSFLSPEYWGADDRNNSTYNNNHGYNASSFLMYLRDKYMPSVCKGDCAFVKSFLGKCARRLNIDSLKIIREILKIDNNELEENYKNFCEEIFENNKTSEIFNVISINDEKHINIKSINKITINNQPLSVNFIKSSVKKSENIKLKEIYVKDNQDQLEKIILNCSGFKSKTKAMDENGIVEFNVIPPLILQFINYNTKPNEKTFEFESIIFKEFTQPILKLDENNTLSITVSNTFKDRDSRFRYQFMVYNDKDEIVKTIDSSNSSIKIKLSDIDSKADFSGYKFSVKEVFKPRVANNGKEISGLESLKAPFPKATGLAKEMIFSGKYVYGAENITKEMQEHRNIAKNIFSKPQFANVTFHNRTYESMDIKFVYAKPRNNNNSEAYYIDLYYNYVLDNGKKDRTNYPIGYTELIRKDGMLIYESDTRKYYLDSDGKKLIYKELSSLKNSWSYCEASRVE